MGGISESRSMTEAERKNVCAVTVDEAKGKVPVIQGTIATSTHMCIKLAKDAEEAGAAGILLPFAGSGNREAQISEDVMYNHFYAVAKAVPDLEIMLYDNPNYGAIPVSAMKKLAANASNFKYVKTQITVQKAYESVLGVGDKCGVFAGTDTYLVPWLQIGCVGGTNSCPNVIPMHSRKIYEAALKKDWDAVNENWFKCWPVIYSFYGFRSRTYKHALYWLGIFDSPRYLDESVVPAEEALKFTRKALTDIGMKLVK